MGSYRHNNGLLLNFYRNGADSMGWHADDEPELGINPVIASVSFGETRTFQFKHKENAALKSQIDLENGSKFRQLIDFLWL